MSFNPRTRVGCDVSPSSLIDPASKFQSTHPRGVRRVRVVHFGRIYRVSIHAPAWGATREQRDWSEFKPVSIHAPAWGATPSSPGAKVN